MNGPGAALISVDGVNGDALKADARLVLSETDRARRGGVSMWDASGLFEELAVADKEAGTPSARTLLLLYAADLAFRLRWEIQPALAEGRVVVAAPYVDTAVAFGRAAGLRSGWVADLFRFAPRPAERRYVDAAPARAVAQRRGFVEFGCGRLTAGLSRRQILDGTRTQLQAAAARLKPRARLQKNGP